MRQVAGLCVTVVLSAALLHAQVWPQWRGPTADGVATTATAPVTWSATEHVRWTRDLAGAGTSSPVVWGDRVFVTSQVGSGAIDERGAQFPGTRAAPRLAREDAAIELVVHAIALSDGRPLWEHRFAAEEPLPAVHRNHNFATPSPVTDGTVVVAWFGTGQIVALGVDGTLRWQQHLGRDHGPFDVLWGHGSSPVLYRDLVVLQVDHPQAAYLLALDSETGATRWKVDRGTGLRSYSTPLVITHDGRDALVVNSSDRVAAYAPETGAALWHAGAPVPLGLPMPVYRNGVIYTSRGYASGPYLAIAAGGRGDVSATHLHWRHPTRAPYVSSLLIYDGLVYMATENGIVTATDAETGDVVWRERLGGVFAASPVAAGGLIYLTSEAGETVVLSAGRQFRVVARNRLDERTLASPAIVGTRMLIRTDQRLFCIEKAP